MAGSVNKVIIIGNLGQDPEIRNFQNGGRIASLSVATSESWKDKASGERKEKTQWHRVVIKSEPLVGVAERFLKKGSKVYLEGQLETRKFTDKDGIEKYTTEVVLAPYKSELVMLDGLGKDKDEQPDTHKGFDKQGDVAQPNNMDDEIPF